MLQVTADLYSGRPNPTWTLSDDHEVRAAMRDLASQRAQLEAAPPATGGLGDLRGFYIDVQNDELATDHGLPPSLYVPLAADGSGGPLHALADRLIGTATTASLGASGETAGGQTLKPEDLQPFLRSRLSRSSGVSSPDSNAAAHTDAAAAQERAAITCMIETGAYNPGFWNNDATVRTRNNCYNYASNKRTDTFAQPGRGSGHMYTAITCQAVTAASLSDGLHQRFVCFPDSEKPRYVVALVIAPGPGFVDFHWYRKNTEGFWSHKPGGTAVRNVDNSNHVISDPQTCNRGPYTQFCGYFYTCRSQRIN